MSRPVMKLLCSAVTEQYMYICVITNHQFLTMFHNSTSCIFGNAMDESKKQGSVLFAHAWIVLHVIGQASSDPPADAAQ
jgi:hypothetical protein